MPQEVEMTAKELLEKITALLSEDDFFRDFKFRKAIVALFQKKMALEKMCNFSVLIMVM